jgi:hypothetical protein
MSRPVEVSDVEFNGDAGTSFLRIGLWKRNVPKAGFPKQGETNDQKNQNTKRDCYSYRRRCHAGVRSTDPS